MKNGQKKFLRARNIILIVLMVCCLGGCHFFSAQQSGRETEYMKRLDSLPELTTTAQILQAVKAPQKQLYVINNYQFPIYTAAQDPYHNSVKNL